MLLLISALETDIQVADPFPMSAQPPLFVAKGASTVFKVSSDVLFRLTPQLQDLESRINPNTGAPLMTWTSLPDYTGDSRAEVALSQPSINSLHPGVFSVGSGNVGVVAKGNSFLLGQTKAAKTIGTGAGSVVYTAVLPGSDSNKITVRHVVAGLSTALSVSVSGNAITVNLATDGAGVATSTAAQVIAAVAAAATAAAKVLATVGTAGVAQAAAATYLAGGKGPGCIISLGNTGFYPTAVSDTQLTFTVTTGALAGLVATDTVTVTYIAGLWQAQITAVLAA